MESVNERMDIEFFVYDVRYNISWEYGRPYICVCPDGAISCDNVIAKCSKCRKFYPVLIHDMYIPKDEGQSTKDYRIKPFYY